MILQEDIIDKLDEGERVEADNICECSAPQLVKCPKGFTRPEKEKEMRGRAGGRHETVNERINHFNCLVNPFKGKGTADSEIERHSNLFRSCCVTTQVAMELGIGELHQIGDDYEQKVNTMCFQTSSRSKCWWLLDGRQLKFVEFNRLTQAAVTDLMLLISSR
jgi:hypothetical protein